MLTWLKSGGILVKKKGGVKTENKYYLVTVEWPSQEQRKLYGKQVWLVASSYHDGARRKVLKEIELDGYEPPETVKVHQVKQEIQRVR